MIGPWAGGGPTTAEVAVLLAFDDLLLYELLPLEAEAATAARSYTTAGNTAAACSACSRRPPDESTIKGRRQSASEAAAANKGWSKLASAALAGLANCRHEGTKVI